MQLDVYVQKGCCSCDRAVQIASEMQLAFPAVVVRVHDVTDATATSEVFAVPTFVLDGGAVWLGNPKTADLREAIEAAIESG